MHFHWLRPPHSVLSKPWTRNPHGSSQSRHWLSLPATSRQPSPSMGLRTFDVTHLRRAWRPYLSDLHRIFIAAPQDHRNTLKTGQIMTFPFTNNELSLSIWLQPAKRSPAVPGLLVSADEKRCQPADMACSCDWADGKRRQLGLNVVSSLQGFVNSRGTVTGTQTCKTIHVGVTIIPPRVTDNSIPSVVWGPYWSVRGWGRVVCWVSALHWCFIQLKHCPNKHCDLQFGFPTWSPPPPPPKEKKRIKKKPTPTLKKQKTKKTTHRLSSLKAPCGVCLYQSIKP